MATETIVIDDDEPTEEAKVYAVVNNIPPSFHSADLRRFFSAFLETEGFDCFHFRHRPEIQSARSPLTIARTSTAIARNKESADSDPKTFCCIVRVTELKFIEFLRTYHQRKWLGCNGVALPTKCLISRMKTSKWPSTSPEVCQGNSEIQSPESEQAVSRYQTRGERRQVPADREEFKEEDLVKLPELRPPPVMARGNVGTPTMHFMALIQDCKLPSSIIRKLRLDFPKAKHKGKYGSVPYDYKTGKTSGADGNSADVKTRADSEKNLNGDERTGIESNVRLQRTEEISNKACSSNVGNKEQIGRKKTSSRGERTRVGEFERHTKGIGRKVLEKQGWKEGTGLGSSAEGIADALENEGQNPRDRQGFGYGKEVLVPEVESEIIQPTNSNKEQTVSKTPCQNNTENISKHTVDVDGEPEYLMKRRLKKLSKQETKRLMSERIEEKMIEFEKGGSDSNEDNDSCEEWERHEAMYDDVTNQGRNKDRLFEEEMEVVWEKGGSGLVFYTDAQYWDQQEGDFDEQTADDLDVDMSVYYEDGAGDKDIKDFLLIRQEQRRRRGLEPTDRFTAGIGKFERHTKGIGRKLLEKQGWTEGTGLGSSVEGIADALDNEGKHPRDRQGFGYRGEKLVMYRNGKSRGGKRRRGEDVLISTVYDDPARTDPIDLLKRRNDPEFIKHRNRIN